MRADDTAHPNTPDEQRPGYVPESPNTDELGERSMTSSGITMTGGVAVGSASDRKQPDMWARRHGTVNNLGEGAVDIEEED